MSEKQVGFAFGILAASTSWCFLFSALLFTGAIR